MSRGSGESLDAIIGEVVSSIIQRVTPKIAEAIAANAAAQVERELGGRASAPRGIRRLRRRVRPSEMTTWVADRRARRVPTFVIEATGLDTKKKIVARFGEDATFEKGKPVPPARAAESRQARADTTKPRAVRKHAAAK